MPPNTIKCSGCNKQRAETRFSQNQIRAYTESARRARDDESRVKYPCCSDCSGGNVHELECTGCGLVLSLDHFSKNMRRTPDSAACLNCSQDKQDLEPHHRDQIQEEININRLRSGATTISHGLGSTAMGRTAGSRLTDHPQSITATNSVNAGSNSYAAHEPGSGGSIHNSVGHFRPQSPSNASINTYVSNPTAVAGTGWDYLERTHASYRRGAGNAPGSSPSNPGFARTGAVKAAPEVRAQMTLARRQARESEQANQAVTRDDDDDDDDSSDGEAY